MKPIFRWTIGNPSMIGYECLYISIKTMLKLYRDSFDYYVCFNNCNIQILRELIGQKNIRLIKQTWNDCPLPVSEDDNKKSSLWKFCPARLNIDCHEIVCDNDVVIVNRIPEIEEFLNSNKVLLVEDPIKFQGKFRHLFQDGEKYNAGFVGMPPKYNLALAMKEIWEQNGSPMLINHGDEQGLTTAALKREPYIKLSKDKMMLVHSEGSTVYFKYNEINNTNSFGFAPVNFFESGIYAYHFVRMNQCQHSHWHLFKRDVKNKAMI